MKTVLISCLLVAAGGAGGASESPADLVLRHGRIYTIDAARAWAEAVAVKDGRIVYVGDDAGAARWVGPATRSIDAGGRFVLPSFTDSHVHPISAGIEMSQCQLADFETKEQVISAVKEYATAHAEQEWVMGNTWQLPVFTDANPRKEWLDTIVPDRPVLLTAADGHSAWLNSKALALAGITRSTPNPPSGRIERDASGEPTGTLRESALELVLRVAPKPTLDERVAGLEKAVQMMNRVGITQFQDASVTEGELAAYQKVESEGKLTARVVAALYADPEGSLAEVLEQVQRFKRLREQYSGKYFRATTVKIFEDGVVEANTAALLRPYLDRPTDSGSLIWEPEKLRPFVELVDRERFQVHFHAIGDRAIRVALTSLAAAEKTNGARDRRPLIAHLELIDPSDIPRFAALSVIPVFQPIWAYEDPYIKDLTIPKLGPTRMRWVYPIGSTYATGATLAMGSDWSVSSVNPLEGIEVVVTRQDPDGPFAMDPPFNPEERIALPAALAAYTIGGAYANFTEKETGSIEVGKSADLIVLSENLFAIPPSQISEARVLLTLFEGKTVYRDPSW